MSLRSLLAYVFARREARWCRCDHPIDFHEHYRAGSECSLLECDCRRFRQAKPGRKTGNVGSFTADGTRFPPRGPRGFFGPH